MLTKLSDGQIIDLGDNPSPEDIDMVLEEDDRIKGEMYMKANPAVGMGGPPSGVTQPDIQPGVMEEAGANLTGALPSMARAGGGMLGAGLGLASPIPGGMAIGGALGAGAGDILAQNLEMGQGTREEYNPMRTLAEGGAGALSGAPLLNKVPSLLGAAGVGALEGAAGTVATEYAETGEAPDTMQVALSALAASGLGAAFKYGIGRQAARTMLGEDELAGAAEMVANTAPKVTKDPLTGEYKEFAPIVWNHSEPPPAGVMAERTSELKDLFDVPPTVPRGFSEHRVPTQKGERVQHYRRQRFSEREYPDISREDFLKGKGGRAGVVRDLSDWQKTRIGEELQEPGPSRRLRVESPVASPYDPEDVEEMIGTLAPEIKVSGERFERDYLSAIRFPTKVRDVLSPSKWSAPLEGRRRTRFIPKFEAAALEEEFGVPVFQDYKSISDAARGMEKRVEEFVSPIVSTFKNTNKGDRKAVFEWLVAPDREAREALGYPGHIVERGKVVERMFNRYGKGLGVTADDLFHDIIPRMAQGEKVADLPAKYKKIVKYALDDDLNLGEPDVMKMATRFARTAAFDETMGDHWASLMTKYDDKSMPLPVKEMMVPYLNAVRGRHDMGKIGGIIYNSILGSKPQLTKADQAQLREDIQSFTGNMLSTMYMGTMGFRLGPVIKNATQGVQTGVALLGGKQYAKGLRQMMTEEGQEVLKRSGLFGEEQVMQELSDIGQGKWGQRIKAGTRASLYLFRKAEHVARAPVYLGMRDKVREAGKVAKNWDMMADLADLDRFTPAEGRYLKQLYDDGRWEDLEDQAGKMLVDNTQFMYGAAERKPLLQTPAGRIGGAFSTWPTSYAAYAKRSFADKHGPGWKRIRDFGRFVGANAALLTGFTGLGSYFGDEDSFKDNLEWTGFGPAIYTGGPALGMAYHGAEMVGSTLQGSPRGGRQFFRDVSAQAIPFGLQSMIPGAPKTGITGDVMQIFEEEDAKGKFGRLMGLKRGKQ